MRDGFAANLGANISFHTLWSVWHVPTGMRQAYLIGMQDFQPLEHHWVAQTVLLLFFCHQVVEAVQLHKPTNDIQSS